MLAKELINIYPYFGTDFVLSFGFVISRSNLGENVFSSIMVVKNGFALPWLQICFVNQQNNLVLV